VLRAGYYWPTLFKHAHVLCHKCIVFQKVVGQVKKATFSLQPVTVDSSFQQLGLDIIGPINISSSQQHKYIITAMDYFYQMVRRWTFESGKHESGSIFP
jgi:hypothetical protein